MKKLIFLNTIFLILCFIMFLLGSFPEKEIKQVQEISTQEANTQEEYSQILEEKNFENRELMESFVRRFHKLSKQDIKILLDTLENNAKEPIIMLSIYEFNKLTWFFACISIKHTSTYTAIKFLFIYHIF